MHRSDSVVAHAAGLVEVSATEVSATDLTAVRRSLPLGLGLAHALALRLERISIHLKLALSCVGAHAPAADTF